MKIYNLAVLLVLIVILTGCSDKDEITELKSQIANLEETIEKNKVEYDKVKSKLDESKDKNLILKGKCPNLEVEVLKAQDNYLWYGIKEVDQVYQTINIIGYERDNITEEFSEINIDGVGQGELFKIKVIGNIYDFELVELESKENSNELQELRVINNIDKVRNSDIIINTRLSEGIPLEKVKWKDQEGNDYEYFMGYDGYGFGGTMIWGK